MTTQQIRSSDVSSLPDHVLALEIIRARMLVDNGQAGMQRRLDELLAERERRG